MLSLKNISYSAGHLQILNDVSMDVQKGELFVIAGSNGAGKSTLLKIACGELKTPKGGIDIQGKPFKKWKPNELAQFAAVLQQQTILTLPFTVKEVVMMGRYPHYRKAPSNNDEQIVMTALEKVGITHLAERSYLHLSGGEQQRVQLARVFAQIAASDKYETRYLFMDEPSNNLDIRHQHNSLQIAKEFAAQGHCVIAILHDLNLALQYADKMLLLKKGNTVAYGKPRDIINGTSMSDTFDYPIDVFNHSDYEHPIIMPSIHQTVSVN